VNQRRSSRPLVAFKGLLLRGGRERKGGKGRQEKGRRDLIQPDLRGS